MNVGDYTTVVRGTRKLMNGGYDHSYQGDIFVLRYIDDPFLILEKVVSSSGFTYDAGERITLRIDEWEFKKPSSEHVDLLLTSRLKREERING